MSTELEQDGQDEGGEASRADTIDALWDAAEKADDTPAAPVQAAAPAEAPIEPPEPVTPEAAAPAESDKAAQAKPEGERPAPAAEPEKPASIKTEKAPQSWTPAAREKWATLPGEVRAEVQRREKEVARVLQETAEVRKGWDAFRATVAPYEGMMRAEGAEPLAAVKSLVETAAALRTAPAQHKEIIAASIIRSYGIDPAGVARVLAGQAPAQGQPRQADPNAIAAQVRAQVMREMERRQVEGQRSQYETQIQEFAAGHEFFEDVAAMLPGIIQGRRDAGLPTTLEQAYSMACQLHPEVSAVVKQREAASQANAVTASTQRARAAAASVKGGPAAGLRRPVQPTSRMDAIEAAMQGFE